MCRQLRRSNRRSKLLLRLSEQSAQWRQGISTSNDLRLRASRGRSTMRLQVRLRLRLSLLVVVIFPSSSIARVGAAHSFIILGWSRECQARWIDCSSSGNLTSSCSCSSLLRTNVDPLGIDDLSLAWHLHADVNDGLTSQHASTALDELIELESKRLILSCAFVSKCRSRIGIKRRDELRMRIMKRKLRPRMRALGIELRLLLLMVVMMVMNWARWARVGHRAGSMRLRRRQAHSRKARLDSGTRSRGENLVDLVHPPHRVR